MVTDLWHKWPMRQALKIRPRGGECVGCGALAWSRDTADLYASPVFLCLLHRSPKLPSTHGCHGKGSIFYLRGPWFCISIFMHSKTNFLFISKWWSNLADKAVKEGRVEEVWVTILQSAPSLFVSSVFPVDWDVENLSLFCRLKETTTAGKNQTKPVASCFNLTRHGLCRY